MHVYNFGGSGYYSAQERALFIRLIISGFVPNMAIFIDGLNDLLIQNDTPLMTKQLRRLVEQANQGENRDSNKSSPDRFVDLLRGLPFGRAARAVERRLNLKEDAEDSGMAREPQYDDEGILLDVINRWLTNKKMIESVAREFDIRSVFVWQPVPVYKYDLTYHYLYGSTDFRDFARPKDGYSLMNRIRTDLDLGDNFLWLADMQAGRTENLYVDEVHYTASFSREIAFRIYQYIREQSLLATPSIPTRPQQPEQ